jgi:hypothetical protein
MNNSPLTLSREDLYELAWFKPMPELAKDFGISSSGPRVLGANRR